MRITIDVSAEKNTPSAVPASSSLEGSKLVFLPPAITYTKITAPIAPRKAPRGIKREKMEKRTAPSVAPDETPMSPGSARLFQKNP